MALYDPNEFPEAETVSPDFTVADKLDEARALIERGWCQRALERNGSYCVLGAVCQAALGDARKWDSRVSELTKPFRLVTGCGGIAEWNNAPERTQAEVIEAFRKAADLARAEAA